MKCKTKANTDYFRPPVAQLQELNVCILSIPFSLTQVLAVGFVTRSKVCASFFPAVCYVITKALIGLHLSAALTDTSCETSTKNKHRGEHCSSLKADISYETGTYGKRVYIIYWWTPTLSQYTWTVTPSWQIFLIHQLSLINRNTTAYQPEFSMSGGQRGKAWLNIAHRKRGQVQSNWSNRNLKKLQSKPLLLVIF